MQPWRLIGDKPAMAKNGHKFINQYLVLEQHATKKDPSDIHTWRARPKFHLLQHLLDLACEGLRPKDVWNYRDETFGYTIQQLWFRRGGRVFSPGVESEKVLLRWSNVQQPWSLQQATAASSSKG